MVFRSSVQILPRSFLLSVIVFIGAGSISCSAQPLYLAVESTPYDLQMSRVSPILNGTSVDWKEQVSLTSINQWMHKLRAIPYRYCKKWKTPREVKSSRVADCKGKAIMLYERMRADGARNVRLVIGKRHMHASQTHAWVEWDVKGGTYLLDPTFNWVAKAAPQDPTKYIPFYAYEGVNKYRAYEYQGGNATIVAGN
jgi:hypothetical protein